MHICDHILRFCNSGTCNRNETDANRVCTCPAGTVGAQCEPLGATASVGSSGSDNNWVIPVVVVVVLVMAGAMVLVFVARKNSKSDSSTVVNPAAVNWDGIDAEAGRGIVAPHVANTSFAGDSIARTASAQAQLAFLKAKLATADEDYDRIDKEKESATYRASHDGMNAGKNRYQNVKAYDDTRVRIIGADAAGTDYINANHVTATVGGQQLWYIASQGPMRNTFEDFWAMVWQQRAKLIAMVTGLQEGGRIKCDRYWPENEGEEILYGDFGVTIDRRRNCGAYTATCFRVRSVATGEQRAVWHLHYTSWPDFGVPTDQGMLAFLGEIREVRQALGGMDVPVVAHCSAGIGRTGVLIMTDVALAKLEAGELPDLELQLEELREQRAGLVQTAEQYRFCYSCLVGAMQFSANAGSHA